VRAGQKRFETNGWPLAVPVAIDDPANASEQLPGLLRDWMPERPAWESYTTAWTLDLLRQKVFQRDPNAATVALQGVLVAYDDGDAKAFNKSVAEYRELLAKSGRDDLSLQKVGFE